MENRKNLIKKIILAAKLILSLSLIILLFTQIDTKTTKQLIFKADPKWIIVVLIFYLVQISCAAKRWGYVLNSLEHELPFSKSLRLVMVGQFFNQCLPSNIGGDAMRMYYLRDAGVNTHSAVTSVLLDRIMGLIVLIFLATVCLPLLASRIDNTLAVAGLAMLVSAGWLITLSLFFLENRFTRRFDAYRFLNLLSGLSRDLRALVANKNSALGVFSTSLLIHLCSIGVAWAIDKALGGDASFIIYLIAMIPTLLVVSIPVSIAGWGVREQALIIILGGMGITSAHAFSVSILFGAVLILGSTPGVVFWLKSGRRTRQA